MAESIQVQPYEGVWNELGRGAVRGAVPSDVNLGWDEHGPTTLGLSLQGVGPKQVSFDLAEFTPIQVVAETGSDPVWSGRIIETPTGQGGVNVQAEGWQQHLDDDTTGTFYAHTNLSDYQDARGLVDAPLTSLKAAGNVEAGNGTVVLSANGSIPGNIYIAATLDLGPVNTAKRIIAVYDSGSNPDGFWRIYLRGHTTLPNLVASGIDAVANHTLAASGTLAGTFASPVRYVSLLLFYSYGGNDAIYNAPSEAKVRFTSVLLTSDTAYESGNGSALKASTVAAAEFAKCPLLSTDVSDIIATTFNIPSLGGPNEEGTPRGVIERANAYHRYRWGVDALRRPYFEPQPAVPLIAIRASDPGVQFEDASSHSGRDMRNKVIVTGNSGGGTPLREIRTTANLPGAPRTQIDRRGFTRSETLTVTAPTDPATMQLLGDLFLQSRIRPPMRGSLAVTGPAAFDQLSGRRIPPIELASRAGELVRILDLPDPYSGDIGRDVKMVSSSYARGVASIALDEDRSSYEALQARLGVVQGQQT